MARVSIKEWMDLMDIQKDDLMTVMEEASSEGICPALCDEGCEVEPDGTCPHGAPSLMLAMGVI